MISIFQKNENAFYAVGSNHQFSSSINHKLTWLFGGAQLLNDSSVPGDFIGPRKEMITPWSTNAVEITQNMGIEGIERIEEYRAGVKYDPMLNEKYAVRSLHRGPM